MILYLGIDLDQSMSGTLMVSFFITVFSPIF